MVNYVVNREKSSEFIKIFIEISQNIQFCEISDRKMGSRIQRYGVKHYYM